jgi:hypothetical protein
MRVLACCCSDYRAAGSFQALSAFKSVMNVQSCMLAVVETSISVLLVGFMLFFGMG